MSHAAVWCHVVEDSSASFAFSDAAVSWRSHAKSKLSGGSCRVDCIATLSLTSPWVLCQWKTGGGFLLGLRAGVDADCKSALHVLGSAASCSSYGFIHPLDTLAGVDDTGEWFAGEAEEEVAAELEGFFFLELVGGAVACSDAIKGGFHGEVEDDEVIGQGSEGFVFGADFSGVDAAIALICHGGKIIPIEDDDTSALNGRVDEFFDVLFPVLEKILKLILDGEPTCCGAFAELAPPWAIRRLVTLDYLMALLTKVFC